MRCFAKYERECNKGLPYFFWINYFVKSFLYNKSCLGLNLSYSFSAFSLANFAVIFQASFKIFFLAHFKKSSILSF